MVLGLSRLSTGYLPSPSRPSPPYSVCRCFERGFLSSHPPSNSLRGCIVSPLVSLIPNTLTFAIPNPLYPIFIIPPTMIPLVSIVFIYPDVYCALRLFARPLHDTLTLIPRLWCIGCSAGDAARLSTMAVPLSWRSNSGSH
ncbi:hypothetical protein RSAG8_13838, partial [Rhizoctonia solani AG-8 WAC10335]